ncbi:MAG: COQ9 family protein [Alphaproteobacteria bacterium]
MKNPKNTAKNPNPNTPLQEQLYLLTLQYVPKYGWSDLAITRARQKLKLPPKSEKLIFPDGGKQVLQKWAEKQIQIAAQNLANSKTKGTTLRVQTGIQNLINQADKNPKLANRAANRLLMPDAAPLAIKLLANASNAIWSAVPDPSLDYNWYSKRAILANVLAQVLIYHHHHNNTQKTHDFLAKKLKAEVQRGASAGRAMRFLLNIPEHFVHTTYKAARQRQN